MKYLRQALVIARIEFGFLRRFPKLLLAALVVTLIPALYLVIYVSSVWNPAANTGALPVGLVNLDQGITHRERPINIGADVTDELTRGQRFGYQAVGDAETARQRVRKGELAFALVIPPDFSANAVPGARPGGGRLLVYTSAGNNFESANIARDFAQALEGRVNDRLNEERWSMVLSKAAGSSDQLFRLREGVRQLHAGAGTLSRGADQAATGADAVGAGAARLQDGVEQLTSGSRQLKSGLRAMHARLPPAGELQRLDEGAQALAAGHASLGQGLEELQAGATRLREGVGEFNEEARKSLFVPAKVNDALGQLDDGVQQLQGGLQSAQGAQRQLAEGAQRLNAGVHGLTQGVGVLGSGLGNTLQRLPDDAQLDRLSSGAGELTGATTALASGVRQVRTGALELALGVEVLSRSLPESVLSLDGNAQGLSHSVRPVLEVDAPVANHGSAFAPNVMLGALWLGAAISAFLIHVRVLPRQARHFHPLMQVLGKALLPAGVVLLQALFVLLTLQRVLRIEAVHLGPLALVLASASLVFLWLVLALTRLLGDAGKALAMVFLALQLSSSGGVLPVELSGSLFETLSPWLPMTWAVKAVKACLFGAFDSAWLLPWSVLVLAGLAALLLATVAGSWRYVNPAQMRPAVQF